MKLMILCFSYFSYSKGYNIIAEGDSLVGWIIVIWTILASSLFLSNSKIKWFGGIK
jgi:hypothetical protein